MHIEIPLTQGVVATIDAEDYALISKYKWHAFHLPKRGIFYARTENILMHRMIMGRTVGDKMTVDHISGDTLDNRRRNLRVATNAENMRNCAYRKRRPNGRLKGVTLRKDGWYQAQIRTNEGRKYLGIFRTEEAAHEKWKIAVTEYHGEFANFDH